MYVWTKEAEEYWQQKKPKHRWHERKAGEEAFFMGMRIEDNRGANSLFNEFVRRGWLRDLDAEKRKADETKARQDLERAKIHRWKMIQRWRRNGLTYSYIAKRLGLKPTSVQNWVASNRKRYTPYFGEIH